MRVKQCIFTDGEETHGGIYCENVDKNYNFVICGCCGGIYELDEITILEIFPVWVYDLDEAILEPEG